MYLKRERGFGRLSRLFVVYFKDELLLYVNVGRNEELQTREFIYYLTLVITGENAKKENDLKTDSGFALLMFETIRRFHPVGDSVILFALNISIKISFNR